MLLLALLRSAASPSEDPPAGHVLTALAGADEREFKWTLDTGLGPLLYRGVQAAIGTVPSARRDRLLAADLTARVRHGELFDTAAEVIDACAAAQTQATLLKGVSISDQFYPAPHLRPMSDVDVLVPPEFYDAVETHLLAHGYVRGSHAASQDHHHGIPLYHAERRTCVELHTKLFPPSSDLRHGELFDPQRLATQSVESYFEGRVVRRFNTELQLVYIGCSWIWDLTLSRIHPSFVAALFDAVYLLRSYERQLNWDSLVAGLDNEMAAASLYATLSFLARHKLCAPPPVLKGIASRQRLVGPIDLRMFHAMIDRYLLAGHPWDLPFPPPVPGRYDLQRQLKKRWQLAHFTDAH